MYLHLLSGLRFHLARSLAKRPTVVNITPRGRKYLLQIHRVRRAMKKQMFKSVFAATALMFQSVAFGQTGMEGGIDELARQIVERAGASERTTIAISAFPHVDDTCSELSNFLVDELVLSLFRVPGGRLQIIERSQLGRIFAEIELSMSGAVDANTTQQLGRLHGVDTLLVGSLTTIGDDLRVNARMINTETGQVFSAAAVNIPKTPTIETLMRRPSAAGCTMTPLGRGESRSTARSAAPARAARSGAEASAMSYSNAFMRAIVSTVSVSEKRDRANISLVVENISDGEIALMSWIPRQWASLTDDAGVSPGWLSNGGIGLCTLEMNHPSFTRNCGNRSHYTVIPPQGQTVISMSFGGAEIKGQRADLSARMLAFTKFDDKAPTNFTLGITGIPLRQDP
jgi:TolB-like protein